MIGRSDDQPEPKPEDPEDGATRRGRERQEEDERFTSVILKRTEEARRHPDDILQAAIEEGLLQLYRTPLSLFLSAVAAGLLLGFTAMSAAVMTVAAEALDWPTFERVVVALVYPLGFVVCLMSGVELFTEHTATAVYPVLDRKANVPRLLRLWLLVAAGNLIGAACSALLLTAADDVVGARRGYLAIGHELVEPGSLPLFVSALLAGWLMALGAWLILATPPGSSQLMSIYLVTFLIGLGGLHHSIAGAAEIMTAYLMSEELALLDSSRFLATALIGNLVGGSLFVAVLNYGHIRKTQE